MSKTETVACPHCSSTQTFQSTCGKGSGSQAVQCKKCHKTFRVYFVNGEIEKVQLH